MKRIVAGFLLAFVALAANAQHFHHHGHGCCYRGAYGGNWVAPALIGGIIGYEISRNTSPAVVQQPVIVQQPVVVQQQPAEVVYIDGVAYKKQVMVINGVAQEVLVRL